MNLYARVAPFRELDPDSLPEAELRAGFPALLSLAEECLGAVQALQAEVQRLEAAIARLKGEHAPPTRPTPGGPAAGGTAPAAPADPASDHSSERERQARTPRVPRAPRSKLLTCVPDRIETLTLAPEALPPDAVNKGFTYWHTQDLRLELERICFRRAKYYSPSTQRTYLAPLPPGYTSHFGPGVRALALSLVYDAQVSLPALHTFFTDAALDISRGQVARLVTAGLEPFHAEQRAILQAGLAGAPWQQWDATSTPVDGGAWHCHVLTNPLYTAYHTAPRQDRAAVLDALRGGAPRQFRLDTVAFAHFARVGVPRKVVRELQSWPAAVTWSAAAFRGLLERHLPRLRADVRKDVEDGALLAAYHADPEWPVATCLLGDDAAVLPGLTAERSLCWIHDARHYTKLLPQFQFHRRQLARFREEYWDFYAELLAYRAAPAPAEAARLEACFDQLFSREFHWSDLRRCVERTRGNKAELLHVLAHPELPLHNNAAELAARRRVRKRDVSFGPRSEAGRRAWDTFQGLSETLRKHGVRFWAYLQDRIQQRGAIPPIAELIEQRAEALPLGASWDKG